MSRQLVETFRTGKDWLASTAGMPLRATYDFLFPPLDDIFLDDSSEALDWRDNTARRTVYDRMSGTSSASAAAFGTDDGLDRIDVWDSFSDSPWSFVTSRYTVALAIVAIINNRVQHICRPRGGASARLSQLQRIALRLPALVLLARSVFIFTTIVADAFLAESNPLNILLRNCTTTPWRNAWLANTSMSGWAHNRFGSSSRDALLRARDAAALWAAFTSTCVAVISDAVVRNLDADRDEPPSFNLVGFAFLLHFHSFSPDAPANEHVYLCVLLQILQIFTLSLSRCRRPAYARRLVVSATFGVASLVHYALAASSGRYPFLEALSRTPEIALVLVVLLTVFLHALTMLLLEGTIKPHRLLFSRSNLPSLDEDWSLALFKLGTACMESTRLTGLEHEVEPLFAWEVPYIELSQDGRIELVDPLRARSTAARVQQPSPPLGGAGSFGGLSREVKEIRIEPSTQSENSAHSGHAGLARIYAFAQFMAATLLVLRNLAIIALRKVFRMVGLPDPNVPQWVYRGLRLARLVWHGRNGETRRRERQEAEAQRLRQRQQQQHQHRRRQRYELDGSSRTHSQQGQPRTDASSAGSFLGFSRLYGRGAVASETSGAAASLEPFERAPTESERLFRDAAELHAGRQRWVTPLAGHDDGDDEDDSDFDVGAVEEEEDADSDGEDSPQEAKLTEVDADEVSGLIEELGAADEDGSAGEAPMSTLLTLRSGTEAFNRLLLAHLTRPRHEPPLTRSGYAGLMRQYAFLYTRDASQAFPAAANLAMAQADISLAQALLDRRASADNLSPGPVRSAGDEARRLCVVCCTEERNVICWPCRCLCLCMDCREHLASRPPARRGTTDAADPGGRARNEAAHLCPTCRTPVQAFSRLFIP